MDLFAIDRGISDISANIDFFSLLAPLNLNEESERFFEALKGGAVYNPEFSYAPADLTKEEKWLLDARTALDKKDPMQDLFLKKIEFILTQIEFITSDDGRSRDVAIRLHGRPDPACMSAARKILDESSEGGYVFPDETVTPREMVNILREYIGSFGLGWKVELNDSIVPKVTVSGRTKSININSSINYTPDEIERLKIHEVEVHVFRGVNGYRQPYRIFAEGLAGYNETEEGLALVVEKAAGCHVKDTRQMKLYAGRALCVGLCLEGSFYEVFSALREYFPDDLAYRLAERGKRGLVDTSLPGGFTKDAHYISGMAAVQGFLDKGGDPSLLYAGKVGLGDIPAIGELLADGSLVAPKYLPRCLKELYG